MTGQQPDEMLVLCDELIEMLARPITERERSNGWCKANRKQWLRWVRRTRDQCLQGVVPETSYNFPATLGATGVNGYDPPTVALWKLDEMLSDRIMLTTGFGLENMRALLIGQLRYAEGEEREAIEADLRTLDAAAERIAQHPPQPVEHHALRFWRNRRQHETPVE